MLRKLLVSRNFSEPHRWEFTRLDLARKSAGFLKAQAYEAELQAVSKPGEKTCAEARSEAWTLLLIQETRSYLVLRARE